MSVKEVADSLVARRFVNGLNRFQCHEKRCFPLGVGAECQCHRKLLELYGARLVGVDEYCSVEHIAACVAVNAAFRQVYHKFEIRRVDAVSVNLYDLP